MSESDRINRSVYGVLRSLGWIVPRSEQEVARTELPVQASACAQQPECPTPNRTANADATGLAATLARAAREAGHVTPEIEQAMRRDRQAAEAQRDKAQHGEDVG